MATDDIIKVKSAFNALLKNISNHGDGCYISKSGVNWLVANADVLPHSKILTARRTRHAKYNVRNARERLNKMQCS